VGGILGFVGIFSPGIILAIAFQSLWHALRTRPFLVAFFRGINSGAVGLIFAAVYRIWQVGYLTESQTSGISLGNDPWWVAVAVIAYTSSAWYGVETFLSILGGSVLGLCWYGVTQR
jgi:chromate transport protein ChrA